MQLETGTDELLCHLEDRVATVTLNNPAKRNALSDRLTPALRNLLLELEADSRVGCVVVTGAGAAFCAGGDVTGMGSGGLAEQKTLDERVADLTRRQEALTLRLYELAKPTIAALPGPAAGAGLSIALACDLRVASQRAFITTAFVNIGLSGDYGANWFLNRLLGQGKAKELMFFSDRISAEEAAGLGLVNAVFPEETFRDQVQTYAARLARGPATALRLIKRNLNRAPTLSLRDHLAMEAQHLLLAGQSEDSREAVLAFIEKRKPDFSYR